MLTYFLIFLKIFIFRERGREGERGEKHRCVRETLINCLSHPPNGGTWPATQACALTRIELPIFHIEGTMPKQLSHTNQGYAGLLSARHSSIYWEHSNSRRQTRKGFLKKLESEEQGVLHGAGICYFIWDE